MPLIGEVLVKEGIITNEQLQQVLNEQTKTSKMLGDTLVDLGFTTEEIVMHFITSQVLSLIDDYQAESPEIFALKKETPDISQIETPKVRDERVVIVTKPKEPKKKDFKRLSVSRLRLRKAKELFEVGKYFKAALNARYAMYHAARAAICATEDTPFRSWEEATTIGLRFTYRGYIDAGEIEGCLVALRTLKEEKDRVIPKSETKIIIDKAENFVIRVEETIKKLEEDKKPQIAQIKGGKADVLGRTGRTEEN